VAYRGVDPRATTWRLAGHAGGIHRLPFNSRWLLWSESNPRLAPQVRRI